MLQIIVNILEVDDEDKISFALEVPEEMDYDLVAGIFRALADMLEEGDEDAADASAD